MSYERDFKDLPEGWKWVKFKDYVYFQEGPGLTSDLFEGRSEGIPFLNIRCIQNNYILKDKLQFLDKNIVQRHFKRFLLQENDLVVSSSGTLGRTLFIKREYLPLLLNTSIIRMRPLNEFLSKFYLKYFIESMFFQKEIYRLSTGSAQSNYGPFHLKRISLILPPLPEQRKIAEILETIDNAIEKTDKIIEKYKRIKQGLMQDLLTKGIDENGNIRDEKTHKFKDSPLGRIPEEWEVVRLGEVGEIIMGQSPASALVNQEGNGIPFLQGSAEFGVKYPLPKNWIVKPLKIAPIGSILVSVRAPVGDINIANNVYSIGRGLSAIKINDSKVNNLFIWYNLYFYRNKLVKISQGSTFEAVGYKELNNFLIPLPPLPEQQRIAEILSQIDQTIEKEQQYKEKLQRTKQGLMQDLLTGKVRVNHLVEEEEK